MPSYSFQGNDFYSGNLFTVYRQSGTSQSARQFNAYRYYSNDNQTMGISVYRDSYQFTFAIPNYIITGKLTDGSAYKKGKLIALKFDYTDNNTGEATTYTSNRNDTDNVSLEEHNESLKGYCSSNISLSWQNSDYVQSWSYNNVTDMTHWWSWVDSHFRFDILTNLSAITWIWESSESTTYKVTSTLTNCTLTPTDTEIAEGTETTFTVTANDGYTFNTVPTLNGTAMTKTSDTVYTSTITINADVTIVASADKVPVTYKVASTLTNCTLTPTDTEIAEGTEATFTVTANDGYTFNTVPTLNGTAMTKTSDTVYTSTITINADVTIVASADKVPVTYTVTRDLSHCTITPDTTVLNENTNYTFTVTAETGYEFSRADYVTITGGEFTISDDKKSATATITATQNITILAHALIIQTHKIYITGTLTNCTCNYNNGDDLTENKAVTFTANEGYYFYNLAPEYEVKRSVSTDITTETGALNGNGTQTLIDTTQVKLYIDNETNITIISDITAIVQPVEIINGINIYNISESILQQLMQVRFTLGTVSSGTGTITEETEPIDYGKWITNLYYLPFDVSQYINTENADIILGNKNTSLHSNLLKSYFDIDLGEITIPEFSNSYESENAIIRLYLPFIDDIITIDNMYSGKQINIKYHVDLLEETITLVITSEETPIMYNKYAIGRNLPFFSTENGNTNLHYSNDTKNTVLTAFILVSKNNYTQVLGDNKNTIVQMNYVNDFETSATQEEQEEIINLLSQGVIVK